MDNVMIDLVKRWGSEKIKRANILNQNGANLVYTHGQDVAQKLKLPQNVRDNITPFPSTTIVQQEESTPAPSIAKKAGPMLAGAALLAAGAAAGLFGSDIFGDKLAPRDPAVEAVPASEMDPFVGVTIE